MKKLFLFIGIFLMLSSAIVSAREYEPSINDIGSASQRFGEWVNLNLLTFNKVSKAKVHLEYAERRAIEESILGEEIKRLEFTNPLFYRKRIDKLDELNDEVKSKRTKNLEDAEKIRSKATREQKAIIEENFQKHIIVLESVRAKLIAKNVTTMGIDIALAQADKARGKR